MCSYWAVPLPLQLTWMGEEAIFHCINSTMREAQKLQRNVSIVCMFTNPQPPQSSGFLNQSKWEFSTQKYIYIWVRKKKAQQNFAWVWGYISAISKTGLGNCKLICTFYSHFDQLQFAHVRVFSHLRHWHCFLLETMYWIIWSKNLLISEVSVILNKNYNN